MKRGAILIAIVALAAASLGAVGVWLSVSARPTSRTPPWPRATITAMRWMRPTFLPLRIKRSTSSSKWAMLPDDTNVKAVWSLVAVAGQEPAVLYESPLTLNSGETVAHFTLSSAQPWPAGKYKVEVYLDDKLDRTLEYEVKEPEVKTPTIEKRHLGQRLRGQRSGGPDQRLCSRRPGAAPGRDGGQSGRRDQPEGSLVGGGREGLYASGSSTRSLIPSARGKEPPISN